jgi:glucose/arabinose dehydrogenase
MNNTKTRTLAIVAVFLTAAATSVVGNSFAQTANNNTAATNTSTNATSSGSSSSKDCSAIAANIGGQAVSRQDICDVLILRQSPQIIMQSTNMSLNKFSTTNSLVEFMAMKNTTKGNSSSSPTTSNPKVFVMGEFGLLEPQLAPMLKAAVSYNWTVSAIHNHMVLEKPKLVFVHWSTQGDLNTITTQIKDALITIGKQPGTHSK